MKLMMTIWRIHTFPWLYSSNFCYFRSNFSTFNMSPTYFCALRKL